MSDIFTDEDRLIYRRKEGDREVAHDPDVVWRAFRKAQSDIGVDFDDLVMQVRDQEGLEAEAESDPAAASAASELASLRGDAMRHLADIGRRMFGKEPLAEDGSGWTEMQGQLALLEFMRWREALRVKPEAPPSGSPGTDGPRAD